MLPVVQEVLPPLHPGDYRSDKKRRPYYGLWTGSISGAVRCRSVGGRTDGAWWAELGRTAISLLTANRASHHYDTARAKQ